MTTTEFIKVRHRRMGSKADGPHTIEIDGLVKNTTLGISPGQAYALRDAICAALDDYEASMTGGTVAERHKSKRTAAGAVTPAAGEAAAGDERK